MYPVVIGSDQSSPDVSIRQVSVTQTAFEDAPVTLRADLHASGYAGKDIVVDLYEVSFDSDHGVSSSATEMEPMESVLLSGQERSGGSAAGRTRECAFLRALFAVMPSAKVSAVQAIGLFRGAASDDNALHCTLTAS